MCAKPKKPKKKGLGGVIIAAVLTVFLGAVLALVSLATQDVREVTVMPPEDERVPGAVYWVRGDAGTGSQQWRSMRAAILEGEAGVFELSESDLNHWSRSMLTSGNIRAADANGSESTGTGSLLGLDLRVAEPDFRFADERLHVATRVSIPLFGREHRFVYQVHGRFDETENGTSFVHETSSLGRAPVGYIPVIGSGMARIVARMYGNRPEYNDLMVHWDRVEEAEVLENRVRFVMAPLPEVQASDETVE